MNFMDGLTFPHLFTQVELENLIKNVLDPYTLPK